MRRGKVVPEKVVDVVVQGWDLCPPCRVDVCTAVTVPQYSSEGTCISRLASDRLASCVLQACVLQAVLVLMCTLRFRQGFRWLLSIVVVVLLWRTRVREANEVNPDVKLSLRG